jgi:hypothetical protein
MKRKSVRTMPDKANKHAGVIIVKVRASKPCPNNSKLRVAKQDPAHKLRKQLSRDE